jgi:DNA-binding NtrC family response regulator
MITDLQMGSTDGMTLFKPIHVRNPSLPVLIPTAQRMVNTIVRYECTDMLGGFNQ